MRSTARTVGLQLLAEQWEQFFEALRRAAASGQIPASRANPDESPVSRADFTARMNGDDILLDAQGDLILLRQVDELDVPRAVVTRLRAP